MDIQSEIIHDYNEKDWHEFSVFIEKQFHPRYILKDKKFFDWQYKDNPFVKRGKTSMKVLKYKGKLLGYLGLIPAPMSVGGSIRENACVLCNLMISPECRAFGIGTYLVKAVMDEYELSFGSGYHPKTVPLYKGLGDWYFPCELNRYLKVLNATNINDVLNIKINESEITENNDVSSSIKIKVIKKFDSNLKKFWNKWKKKYPVTVDRSKEYLNWRYSDHPYFDYKILTAEINSEFAGYLVYRLAESTGSTKSLKIIHILDMVAEDNVEYSLLAECVRVAKTSKADLIDYFSTGSFHEKSLISNGFKVSMSEPYSSIPIYFNPISKKRSEINFLMYFRNVDKDSNILKKGENWYVTKGDGDKDRPNPQ